MIKPTGRPGWWRALVLIPCLAAALVPAARVVASDPPHWSSASTTIDCTSACHLTHQALGGTLTAAAGNVTLCQSCHNPAGLAKGEPINNADKAVPGSKGTSHAFDAPAVNATYGAQTPSNAQMALRVMGGQIVCSTCHDQHFGKASFGGTPRVRPVKPVTGLCPTCVVTSGGSFTGANGVFYLIEIQTGGAAGAARFRWSKDNGTTWMFSNVLTGASVALDSGVTVSFGAGTFVVGDRWEFAAAWPFLRTTLDSGDNTTGAKLCRDCHAAWTMDHAAVETYSGTMRSHPVGVALNANGRGYDRPTPLDGNGAVQGVAGADANATNELRLYAGGVQCLTCHSAHYADGNTQSVDAP